MSWINWYVNLTGNQALIEVDTEFKDQIVKEDFPESIHNTFDSDLDTIFSQKTGEDTLHPSLVDLYNLIHSVYVQTNAGMDTI